MTVAKAVKGSSRPYRSELRQEQARRTRAEVLDAAARLFVRDGYAATTMRTIAGEAGVSVETVHAQGTKPSLLLACVDRAVVGDDEPVPLLDRPDMRAVLDADEPRVKLRRLADVVVEGLPQAAPVLNAFTAAAAADPAIAAAVRDYEGRRYADVTRIIGTFGDALRAGLTPERAADVFWTFFSPQVIAMLTEQRGWSTQQYADWLVEFGERMLLAD